MLRSFSHAHLSEKISQKKSYDLCPYPISVSAFKIAWALLKSDDFYEAVEGQNPNYPTMQEAMSMQQDREFREAFQPNHPRIIPQSEYNPYDPSMVKVRGRGGGRLHRDGSFTPHDNAM